MIGVTEVTAAEVVLEVAGAALIGARSSAGIGGSVVVGMLRRAEVRARVLEAGETQEDDEGPSIKGDCAGEGMAPGSEWAPGGVQGDLRGREG